MNTDIAQVDAVGSGSNEGMSRMKRMKEDSIRVCIVDANEMSRVGMMTVLKAHASCVVVGMFKSFREGAASLERIMPDVLIMSSASLLTDLPVPVTRQLLKRLGAKVLVLSSEVRCKDMQRMIGLGITGFVSTGATANDVVKALDHLMNGEAFVDTSVTGQLLTLVRERVAAKVRLPLLSAQEQRIFPLLGEGMTNKEIAGRLALSDRTVKNYVANLFKKLHISRRSQAARLYAEECVSEGIVSAG